MKGTIVLSHRETHRAKVLERVAAGVLPQLAGCSAAAPGVST